MIKDKKIDFRIVAERVSELTNATYDVYCSQCHILSFIPLSYEQYLNKVRSIILKKRGGKK